MQTLSHSLSLTITDSKTLSIYHQYVIPCFSEMIPIYILNKFLGS